MKRLIFSCIIINVLLNLIAFAGQPLTPAEGDSLYFTNTLFRWEQLPNSVYYNLQVAIDGSASPFEDSLVVDIFDSTTVSIVRGELEWDKSYVWRVRGYNSYGRPGPWDDTHTFQTHNIPMELWEFQNTLYDSTQFCPGITFFEAFELTPCYTFGVNMYGDIIWYAPPGTRFDQMLMNDGNLLMIKGERVWIATLNCEYLWHSPGYDHHHAVNLLPNGNFLALRHEFQEVVTAGDTVLWRGDVIEEIADQDTVWSWNTFDYLSVEDYDSVLYSQGTPNGYFDWTHANSCAFDTLDSSIYLSCRNLSRIVKIAYPSGDIIWSMGATMPSGDVDFGDSLFLRQHAPEPQPNGNLLLYNNNSVDCVPNNSSAVEIAFNFSLPEPAYIVWEYIQEDFSSIMGDADRLPNGNTLICAGNQSYLLEVNSAGDEIWKFQTDFFSLYRAERVPSMYPQVFSVITPDPQNTFIPAGNDSICYTLHNEGSVVDTFNIEFHDTQGWFNQVSDMVILDSYSSIQLFFEYSTQYSPLTDTLTLIVTSSLNPESVDSSTITLQMIPGVSLQRPVFDSPELEAWIEVHPNPFNNSTTIYYAVQTDGFVEITIYNMLGRQIKCLVNDYITAGEHTIQWEGINGFNESVSSGIYYCNIKSGDANLTKRLILLK